MKTRKQRDVRGPGERHVDRCIFGERTLRSQLVHGGSFDAVITVTAEPIGTERVDGHEQEVTRCPRPWGRFSAAAAGGAGHECGREQPDERGPRRAQWRYPPVRSSARAAATSRAASRGRPSRLYTSART